MGCRMLLTFILCVAWVLSWTAETARAQTSPIPAADYRVARVWKLGGVGGWDDLTLEESGARLFVSREERVDVIETVSGKLAGSIPRTGCPRYCVRTRAAAWLYQQRPEQHSFGV